jgi:hypothetical protein
VRLVPGSVRRLQDESGTALLMAIGVTIVLSIVVAIAMT